MRQPILFTILISLWLPLAVAANTTITYQGQLQQGGAPTTTTVDMTFTLHDSEVDGTQVAGPLTETVEVTDGQFQVDLDFGDVFQGERWLEIEIDNDPLTPRQRVAPAPVAVRALNVAESANAWQLGGNAGTDPAADFIGTTDTTAFALRVDNSEALRVAPSDDGTFSPNLIGGHPANNADDSTDSDPPVVGAVIGGGGTSSSPNMVGEDFATVGGGQSNTANETFATVGGGNNNTASGFIATVGGGSFNQASGTHATVGGGTSNTASHLSATVGGGSSNLAEAQFATIAGGGPTDSSDVANTRNVIHDEYGAIGGGGNNQAGSDDGDTQNTTAATVGGGFGNRATGDKSIVGGGQSNTANEGFATVGGGISNTAGSEATVGGGNSNTASGTRATVGGGISNTSGTLATVGGGGNNTASGIASTVPGGRENEASGNYSFAAGSMADTNGQEGAFVWGDSTLFTVQADTADQVVFQAGGGMKVYTDSDTSTNTGAELPAGSGSWTGLSSRSAKTALEPVAARAVLAAVAGLDLATWRYRAEDGDVRHMGPMAEDFFEAFGLGHDPRRIANVDADGVALAAIQGLHAELQSTREEMEALAERNAELAERNAALEDRLARLESVLLDDRQVAGEQQ